VNPQCNVTNEGEFMSETSWPANITHRIRNIENADRKLIRGQQKVYLHEHIETRPLTTPINY
jgi:hypothetical protein